MVWLIVKFSLLAAATIVAGTLLTRYADVLGQRSGLGRSLSGIVLLAMVTSLPELVTDCAAARLGAIDMAVGDLLGSCLFNLLILAILDMMHRTHGRMLSRQSAAHALSAQTCILLSAIVMLFIVLDVRLMLWRFGIGTIVVGVTFILALRMVFFDQQHALVATERSAETGPAATDSQTMTIKRMIAGYTVAVLGVFAAAPLLARTANDLAIASDLGGTFVGTILVALATSLPEVSTTRTAVKMGAYDLAIGNIFGSNSFNMFILVGVDLFYAGDLLASVEVSHAVTAAAVIIVTAVATLGLLYRAERKVWTIEYDAGLVVLLVLGAFVTIYWLHYP